VEPEAGSEVSGSDLSQVGPDCPFFALQVVRFAAAVLQNTGVGDLSEFTGCSKEFVDAVAWNMQKQFMGGWKMRLLAVVPRRRDYRSSPLLRGNTAQQRAASGYPVQKKTTLQIHFRLQIHFGLLGTKAVTCSGRVSFRE